MSNIVLGLLILGLIFAMAGFGVYSDGRSTVVGARAARIAGALERRIVDVQSMRNDNGEIPITMPMQIMGDVTISYGFVGGRGFACATVSLSNVETAEALDRVRETRPSWFISGTCGQPGAAVTTNRVISAEV